MLTKRGIAVIAGSLMLLAGAATTPAYAAANSNGSVGPFSIQLYDLNPFDGISPSIIWSSLGPGFGSAASVTAIDSAASNFQLNESYGTLAFSSTGVTASTALSGAQANVVGGPSGDSPVGATLSAQGYAYGANIAGENATYSAESIAPSQLFYTDYFTLSANTAMVVKANASVGASTTVGKDNFGEESAYGLAWLSVWGNTSTSGGTGSQNTYAELTAVAGYTVTMNEFFEQIFHGESHSSTGELSGNFLNLTGTSMSGFMRTGVSAFGSSAVAAVPEPEAYAMYLAGLALMGVTVLRRKR